MQKRQSIHKHICSILAIVSILMAVATLIALAIVLTLYILSRVAFDLVFVNILDFFVLGGIFGLFLVSSLCIASESESLSVGTKYKHYSFIGSIALIINYFAMRFYFISDNCLKVAESNIFLKIVSIIVFIILPIMNMVLSIGKNSNYPISKIKAKSESNSNSKQKKSLAAKQSKKTESNTKKEKKSVSKK